MSQQDSIIMNPEMAAQFENVAREATKLLGSDLHPVELVERINQTPITDVEWSGLRGQSMCTPKSEEVRSMLEAHGVSGIRYSFLGEPDFEPVALAKVKISDMNSDVQHDYSSSIRKFLQTDYAKERGLTTTKAFEQYMKDNGLSIHESGDGVTEYLVEREIHKAFGHYGGRSKYRAFDNPDSDRLIQTKLSEAGVNVNKAVVKGQEIVQSGVQNVNNVLSAPLNGVNLDRLSEINQAGLATAEQAALFTAVMSATQNTLGVLKGEQELDDALKSVAVDATKAYAVGYATGVVGKLTGLNNCGEAGIIVAGAIKISTHIVKYTNGEIDGPQLIDGVVETTTLLASAYVGRLIGRSFGAYGGPIGIVVGQYIGEMITTTVCSEVMNIINFDKKISARNKQLLALYHTAEEEIRSSQRRLESVVAQTNGEYRKILRTGFAKINEGILSGSYEQVEDGLSVIGKKFNLSKAELQNGKVSRQNLFKNTGSALVIE